MGQVIDNIAINAQQAMPLGGELEIRAKNVTFKEGDHPTLSAGNYVRVSLRDCGVGIPPDILPLVFDPFFTTKQKGSGLGLATCYSIVQKHGGIIDVSSELGKGSVFHVILPAAKAEGRAAPLDDEDANRTPGTEGIVLVLDDEDFLREILGEMLERLGFTPMCAATGEEVIEAYETAAAKDPVVAAILDLTVPGGMGGKETVKALHDLNPDLPVFVSSGYSEDPVMCDPKTFGFAGSITKPYRKQEIDEILSPHLRHR
jgi:CheY-like chemotaxis protein